MKEYLEQVANSEHPAARAIEIINEQIARIEHELESGNINCGSSKPELAQFSRGILVLEQTIDAALHILDADQLTAIESRLDGTVWPRLHGVNPKFYKKFASKYLKKEYEPGDYQPRRLFGDPAPVNRVRLMGQQPEGGEERPHARRRIDLGEDEAELSAEVRVNF